MHKHRNHKPVEELPNPAEFGRKYCKLAIVATVPEKSADDKTFMYGIGRKLEAEISGIEEPDALTVTASGNCIGAALSYYKGASAKMVRYVMVSPEIADAATLIHTVAEINEMWGIELDIAKLASYYALIIVKNKSVLYLSCQLVEKNILPKSTITINSRNNKRTPKK